MACETQREAFELAQGNMATAQAEYDSAKSDLDAAKKALQDCEGSGGGPQVSPYTVFDMHLRCRNRGGTGSANVIGETADAYIVDTNHHVSSGPGTPNTIDFFVGGDVVSGMSAVVIESWFKPNNSVDIATLRLPKAQLNRELPIVRMATEADGYEPKIGDQAFFGACAEGLWPRPRSGNILNVQNGLIYYEPNAIGGDSGSAVTAYVNGELLCIGRTAWSTRVNGRWVGLAMTWRRIEQIKRGEVGAWELPPETKYPWEIHVQDGQTWGMN